MDISMYTVADVAGTLAGTLAFAVMFCLPGYALCWATDLAGFRARTVGEKLVWSVPFSVATMTYSSVMISKYASLTAACWVAAVLSGAGLLLAAGDLWRSSRFHSEAPVPRRFVWWIPIVFFGWATFVALELVDFGWADKLYMNVAVVDHAYRKAFIDAVVRTGVPPGNPLYWIVTGVGKDAVGVAPALRYYYFWYVPCGMVVKLFGITSRQALLASCVWAGIALAAILRLYCVHVIGGTPRVVRRNTLMGLGLLLVTGLDLVPVLKYYLRPGYTYGDMEWWSVDQVSSWMDTALWVPHHMAALICCLAAFLLVWLAPSYSNRQKILFAIFASLAFASSSGLSIYVAAAFAILMVIWLCWELVGMRLSWGRHGVLIGAALIAVVLLVPYLHELQASGGTGPSDGKSASHVLAPGLRIILEPKRLIGYSLNTEIGRHHPQATEVALYLALLLPGYALELGFWGAVLLLGLWRFRTAKNRTEAEKLSLLLTLISLLVCTFVRSNVISINDFGMRASLIPQFFLLILALAIPEEAYRSLPKLMKAGLLGMLLLGLAATAYQVLMLRFYLPLQYQSRIDSSGTLPTRTMALRRAGELMATRLPSNSVVQFNTHQVNWYPLFAYWLNIPMQMANAMEPCNTSFGGDPGACPKLMEGVRRIYDNPPDTRTGPGPLVQSELTNHEVTAICGDLKIDYLIATRWDYVWHDRQSWVWTLPASIATPDVRVIPCGRTGS